MLRRLLYIFLLAGFVALYIPGGVVLYNEWSNLYAQKINTDLDETEWTYSRSNLGPLTWFVIPPIKSISLYSNMVCKE